MNDDRPEDGHRPARELLGAYVLGQLDDGERHLVEEHVADCAACAREAEQLSPLVPLLDRVDPAELGAPGPAVELPVDGEARLRSALTATGTRPASRLRGRVAVAALVAVAAVVVAGLVGYQLAPEVPVTRALEAVPVQSSPAVDVSADLVAHTWGVEVKLAGSGFADGERYRVSVVDDRGRVRAAGGFVGTGDDPMLCNLNSSVLRENAVGLRVVDAAGDEIVNSAFAPA